MHAAEFMSAPQQNPFADKRRAFRAERGDALVDEIDRLLIERLAGVEKNPREKDEAPLAVASDRLPVPVGKGGESLVFRLQGRKDPERLRDVVVKVNFSKTLKYLFRKNRKDPAAIAGAEELIVEEMKRRKNGIALLRAYFGPESVPATRLLLTHVPVSDEIVDQLTPGWLNEGEHVDASTLPAWVEVQRCVDLDPEKTVSLNGHYLQVSKAKSLDAFRLTHDILTGQIKSSPKFEKEVVSKAYPTLERVVVLCRDPEFKRAFRGFVRTLIEFTKETRIPLGFAWEK